MLRGALISSYPCTTLALSLTAQESPHLIGVIPVPKKMPKALGWVVGWVDSWWLMSRWGVCIAATFRVYTNMH